MIQDSRSSFGYPTPLNIAMGTSRLGDVIDLAHSGFDASDLYVVISVRTAAASSGAALTTFSIVSDSTSTLAVDGSATCHLATGPIPVGQLTAGARIAAFKLPEGRYERYLGVLQTTTGAPLSAGVVDMFLTPDPSAPHRYADARN